MKHFSALCLLIGCCIENNIESDYTNQLEAITQVRNDRVKAVNATDLDLLLKDMSPDIVYLTPGVKPIIGIEALKNFVASIYQEISPKIEMFPTEVKLHDSLAVEWGIIN